MESTGTGLSLQLLALAAYVDTEVHAALERDGFGDLRTSHGYVFQHLLVAPQTISALAQRLGMTKQGASKAVIELEGLGYVRRTRGSDGRVRLVEMTERGRAGVEAARRARDALDRRLMAMMGDRANPFRITLDLLAADSGAVETMLARRLRPPT